ncbi:hypothetical protein ACIP79_19825 [Streptomyces sp. NPDC088747]|uniref:hypothetical protein n=1 Tax=Streptomyces sp. NPDC088747 TaxID=3365886 RepID=UPI00381A2271
MTGKAGEKRHIRPDHGRDVKQHGKDVMERRTDVMVRTERDLHEPAPRQPRRETADPADDSHAPAPGTENRATAMAPAVPGAADSPDAEAAPRPRPSPQAQRKGMWQWQPSPQDAARIPATEWNLTDLTEEPLSPPATAAPAPASTPRAHVVQTAAKAQTDDSASHREDSTTQHPADGHDPESRSGSPGGAPIFVDPSGRRASRMRRMGWLVAAGCVCSVATLGVAVTDSNSTAPWLRIPGMPGSVGSQDRGADEAPRPGRQAPATPAADSPASTAPEAPQGRRTGTTTAADATTGPLPNGNGTRTAPGNPAATPPSKANGTGTPPTGSTETSAAQPNQTTPPATDGEATTPPGSATPSPPSTPAEPSPTETPAAGLLDGLVDAVSGLLGR